MREEKSDRYEARSTSTSTRIFVIENGAVANYDGGGGGGDVSRAWLLVNPAARFQPHNPAGRNFISRARAFLQPRLFITYKERVQKAAYYALFAGAPDKSRHRRRRRRSYPVLRAKTRLSYRTYDLASRGTSRGRRAQEAPLRMLRSWRYVATETLFRKASVNQRIRR